jgi:hypothetical protein
MIWLSDHMKSCDRERAHSTEPAVPPKSGERIVTAFRPRSGVRDLSVPAAESEASGIKRLPQSEQDREVPRHTLAQVLIIGAAIALLLIAAVLSVTSALFIFGGLA